MKILPTNNQYTKIIHIADLHIRLLKRHDEYREILSVFLEDIKKYPKDATCIAILGDIFHSKTDLQPECIELTSYFLMGCANIFPTILIAGNHDCVLSNKNRLDSLTPIVDALNHPNLFYLKSTGLYGFGNILFNNMGVFDSPDQYIRGTDIPSIYRNKYNRIVALFHGPVDGAATDTGFRINNPAVMTPLFDGHDMALLGDIHKMQNLQEYNPEENKPCVHYAGSCIQQNHGETIDGHGYSVWDVATNSYEHYDLKNNYGYFTIEVYGGKLSTDISNLPLRPRLRVKCYNTISTEVKAVVSNIREKYDIVEVSYVRMEQEVDHKDLIVISKDNILNDVTDIEYQNRLITEYLEKSLNITDPADIAEIIKINKNINALIKKDEFPRNIKWKPIRFEFDNMFSYEEGNVIDFSQMSGTYGIFGPNKSGKSSLLSAMTFCLFDKFDRGFRGIDVRNVKKSSFRCKFELEIHGERYFIERIGETTKSGNVKVGVEFWKEKDGIVTKLNSTARRSTNEVIRDYIGTYEDFILTTLSIQSGKNNIGFVDMGNCDRKDLLVQFIGLNIFDRLSETASERNKELNTLLKRHKDKNYAYEHSQFETSLEEHQTLFAEQLVVVEGLTKQIAGINDQLILETGKLIKLEDDVPSDINALKSTQQSTINSITQFDTKIDVNNNAIKLKEVEISNINIELDKIVALELDNTYKLYTENVNALNAVKQRKERKQSDIQNKLEKIQKLASHKYDPNCKFCMDNSFVKDAMAAQLELESDKIEADKIMTDIREFTTNIEKYKWVEDTYTKYTELLTTRNKIKDEYSDLNAERMTLNARREQLKTTLDAISKQVEMYYRNEITHVHNAKINANIASFRIAHTKTDLEYKKQNKILMDINGRMVNLKSKIDDLGILMDEARNLERESFFYKNYILSVGRDGIPYQVICNTVPEIEREVNSILTQVVEYTIEFETDGKNVIPYIVYDQQKWPIEMSSGFERFVASIAIRVALSEVSNLPRCNNLQIDEGFGSLDANNMSSMYTLFSYLKTRFDFILVVSHIDAMKDAVDYQIEIQQNGTFSKVIHN